ncbi:hypothetical protein EMCG_07938 [[Emmonsia] crescens]|uniref:AAA+ ATPase domain-containing protein n=1 Tax=[Emmonsia] crescens TaxID=73230 RepID=A0A0G2I6S7_9EURO|nr:hypothetical protein EMCG_07938 [Emmonsia crescens UAMH 3008]
MALARARMGVVPAIPFNDFVARKGGGLIVLLFGRPGTGKTMTAEATAEHLRRPLYPIPAVQLITRPDFLEDNLKPTFKIAKHFDALLLLDAADVFLERRSSFNSSKDGVVTIFLRIMEYFQGMFFLTTNRETESDEAILGRIHMKIKYPGLSQQQRKIIWKLSISRACTHQGPATVDDRYLDYLATTDINGRDIKNLMAVAHALATMDGTRVDRTHIERASTSNEDFSR